MRKFIFFFSILFPVVQVVTGQIFKPAKLVAEQVTSEAKAGDVIELVFRAQIDKNWYMYTTGFDPECGPLPVEITLEPGEFQLVGGLTPVNDKKKHDEI